MKPNKNRSPLKTLRLLAITAAIGTIPACVSAPAPTTPARHVSRQTQSIHQSVGEYRKKNGKTRTPEMHEGLSRLAQGHADALSQKTGVQANHEGFHKRAAAGQTWYGFGTVAENVVSFHGCRTMPGPISAKLWSGSPSHNETMLTDWNYTGIGYAENNGITYAVQMFAN